MRVRAALSRDGIEVYGDSVMMNPEEQREILLQVKISRDPLHQKNTLRVSLYYLYMHLKRASIYELSVSCCDILISSIKRQLILMGFTNIFRTLHDKQYKNIKHCSS